MARTRLALLAALAWLTLTANVTSAASMWTYAASEHFEIYTTAGGQRALDALVYFEQVDDFFTEFFKLTAVPHRRTRLIVFSGDKEYAPYRPNESATAFFQPGHERDHIVMEHFDGDAEPTVIHEYTHLMLGQGREEYPAWLAEGLAEFFSTMERDGSRVRLGQAPVARMIALRKGVMMPVTELFAVDHDSPHYTSKSHAGLFYAQSWALVHMLQTSDRYRDDSAEFIRLVSMGTPAAAVLNRVYRRSVADLERDLRQHVARDTFSSRSVIQPPAAPPEIMVSPRAVSAFDAGLVLADLLASQEGNEARARAAYAALERDERDNVPLVESRAFFELKAGRDADARKAFNRAVELGSRNAMVYAELARLIAAADLDRATSLLDTAQRLAPDNIVVRMRVAEQLVRRRRAVDALAALAGTSPSSDMQRYEYFQILANAHALIGDFDLARAAAERVVENSRTADERRFGERLVTEVSGPADMTDVVRGRLRDMNCEGALPVLEVATDAGLLRLVIDDRSKVAVGGGSGAVELECGPQDRPLRIGYARERPPAGTHGRVRFLDFRSRGPSGPRFVGPGT